MRLSYAILVLVLSGSPSAGLAQTEAAPQFGTPQTAAAAPAQSLDASVSAILQPSLDALQQTLGSVRLEKWKGGTVRSEAAANIGSIQNDLQGALPTLLNQADAAPHMLSSLLPVSRNVNALYDVLMRVVDGARVAAPGDQVTQLQQALAGLGKARRTLDDRLQDTSAAQEKQIGALQVAIKNQPVPVCPAPPPPAPAPEPAKKVVHKKKKPATTAPPANSQPAPTTKPNP